MARLTSNARFFHRGINGDWQPDTFSTEPANKLY